MSFALPSLELEELEEDEDEDEEDEDEELDEDEESSSFSSSALPSVRPSAGDGAVACSSIILNPSVRLEQMTYYFDWLHSHPSQQFLS